jgi:hypothetical protein
MKLSKWSRTEKIGLLIVVILVVVIPLQFETPEIKNPPVTGKFTAPKQVTQIYERACYDCHSNETKLRWYDKIAPASWKVAADVHEARSRFNFSEWNKLSPADQQVMLWKTVNAMIAGKMPLPSYVMVHPETKISKADIETLKKFVNSFPNNKPVNIATALASAYAADDELKNYRCKNTANTSTSLPVALNGVRYIAGYRKWQVISSTNRFDNYTMRVVYGNDITVKAIKENDIHPFPNGAAIAKVVWNKIEDKDGNVWPGTFNAVQVMIKDDKKYPKTGGWGFAIFSGLKLAPVGQTALFENDCINCHKMQASENDGVFNIPLKNSELDKTKNTKDEK